MQTSRSPFATRELECVAECQKQPFKGLLKYTRIKNETTYYLEFKPPSCQSSSASQLVMLNFVRTKSRGKFEAPQLSPTERLMSTPTIFLENASKQLRLASRIRHLTSVTSSSELLDTAQITHWVGNQTELIR